MEERLRLIHAITLTQQHHEWAKGMLHEALDFLNAIEAGSPINWEDVHDLERRSVSHIQQTML